MNHDVGVKVLYVRRDRHSAIDTMAILGNLCPKISALILALYAAILLQFSKFDILGSTHCMNFYMF